MHFHRWEMLFVFGILVIAGSSGLLFLLPWPVLDSEPSYQGKTLSAWLRQTRSVFRPIVEKDRAALKNAIRQMGTNAIPYLLKMAARRSSDFREELITLDRSHFHLFGGTYDSEYHEMATLGFSALGADAKPAVPRLIKLLDDPDPEIALGAAEDLAAIGPEAAQGIPALLRVCQDVSPLAPPL